MTPLKALSTAALAIALVVARTAVAQVAPVASLTKPVERLAPVAPLTEPVTAPPTAGGNLTRDGGGRAELRPGGRGKGPLLAARWPFGSGLGGFGWALAAGERFGPAGRLALDRVAFAVDGAESSHGTNPRMWRPEPSGPQGPMQVSLAAAVDVGGGDRFDIYQNRLLGRAYLAHMYLRYGDWPDAIAAYNWGPGNVDAWIAAGRPAMRLPLGVEGYVRRVLRDSVFEAGGARFGLALARAADRRPVAMPGLMFAEDRMRLPALTSGFFAISGNALLHPVE